MHGATCLQPGAGGLHQPPEPVPHCWEHPVCQAPGVHDASLRETVLSEGWSLPTVGPLCC